MNKITPPAFPIRRSARANALSVELATPITPGFDSSASNAVRDRNSPIKAHQINLQRSLIGSEYQPIRGRGQPFWVCGRGQWRRNARRRLFDLQIYSRLLTAAALNLVLNGLSFVE